MRAIIIDNYDSFTANLEHLIAIMLKTVPDVISYDRIEEIHPENYDLIIISPGPGKPSEYEKYARILSGPTPVLGICLGMQIINDYYGGKTDRLTGSIHGRTDTIIVDGRALAVARYHSLYISNIAPSVDIIMKNADGIPMALQHKTKPHLGYQFHPESFLTENGGFFIEYALDKLGMSKPA